MCVAVVFEGEGGETCGRGGGGVEEIVETGLCVRMAGRVMRRRHGGCGRRWGWVGGWGDEWR